MKKNIAKKAVQCITIGAISMFAIGVSMNGTNHNTSSTVYAQGIAVNSIDKNTNTIYQTNTLAWDSLILNQDTSDISYFRAYANEHYGETVEIAGYVSQTESCVTANGQISENQINLFVKNGNFEDAYSYGPTFEIKNIDTDNIEKIEITSNIAVKAQILGFDEEKGCILISLLSIENR